MRVERSIVLPTPPERAWSVVTDWERQAEWMRDADEVRVVDRRDGVGTGLVVRTRLFNVPALTERMEVVVWEPPHRLVLAHRRVVRGLGVWRLLPDPTGTRFVWIEDVTLPVPVLGELAALVYRPFLRRVMAGSMEALRRHVIAIGPVG
jgi:uncharacterized protein YndB with AHSA1/START domain